MRTCILFFIVFGFLQKPAGAQQPASVIPDFSFEKADGSAFTRKNITPGFPSFFIFFDTQCDHCMHAIGYLNTHQQDFIKAKMYLITLDNRVNAKAFLDKHGNKLLSAKNIMLLFDTKDQFTSRFGPRKYPSLMLYSKEGKLLLYDDDEKNLPKFVDKIKKAG